MSPPGQVPRAVRRGKSLQLSCLVPAVGVGEPVDNGGQIMTEHLPQPGHDHPLIIRHRMDAERTARVGRARVVGTSESHPAELTAPSSTARLSEVAFSLTRSPARRPLPGEATSAPSSAWRWWQQVSRGKASGAPQARERLAGASWGACRGGRAGQNSCSAIGRWFAGRLHQPPLGGLALRPADIDLDARTVRVARQLHYTVPAIPSGRPSREPECGSWISRADRA